jgi:hypothetical protein
MNCKADVDRPFVEDGLQCAGCRKTFLSRLAMIVVSLPLFGGFVGCDKSPRAPSSAQIAPAAEASAASQGPEPQSVADPSVDTTLEMERIEKEAHAHPHDWYEVIIGKFDGRCDSTLTRSARADADLGGYSEQTRLTQTSRNGDDYVIVYATRRGTKAYATSRKECQRVIDANLEK